MTDAKRKIYGVRYQLENYFERKVEHLLGESAAAANLSSHSGLVGISSEISTRLLLSELLPSRYALGTGHVVSYDKVSDQVDVVIFDALECFKIPITEAQALYSIEGVYATIEVKSSPSRKASSGKIVEEAVFNIDSVKSLNHPPFTLLSQSPAFTRLTDVLLVGPHRSPIGAILILGSRDKFNTVMEHLKSTIKTITYLQNSPDLLCVLDEENFGVCGFEKENGSHRFWRETCESPGEALAKWLYWLMHKIILERFTEQPIVRNQEIQGIWPSVMAPVISRIKVDASESGTQRSFPWNNDTRLFD